MRPDVIARYLDHLFELVLWWLLAVLPLLVDVANVDAYRTIQATHASVGLAIALGAWAIARCAENSWHEVRAVGFQAPLALLALWTFLSAFRTPSVPLAMLSWWNLVLYLGSFVAIAHLVPRRAAMTHRLMGALTVGFTLNAVLALLQYQRFGFTDLLSVLPRWSWLGNYFAGLDAPARLGSAAGVLGNQNVLGEYLVGAIGLFFLSAGAGLMPRRPVKVETEGSVPAGPVEPVPASGPLSHSQAPAVTTDFLGKTLQDGKGQVSGKASSGLVGIPMAVFHLVVALLGMAALVATQTRGAWIGLLGGGLLLAVILLLKGWHLLARMKPATWAIVLAVLLAGGGGLAWKGDAIGLGRAIQKLQSAGTDGTSQQRINAWKVALTMAQDAPLMGQGLGSYKVLYFQFLGKTFAGQPVPELMHHRYVQAHNDFVQAAGETGWPGLLIILGILGAWCWRLVRDSLRLDTFTREDRVLVWGGVVGLVSISGSAVFGFPFHLAAVSTLLLVVAALAHGIWSARTQVSAPVPLRLEDELTTFARTLLAPAGVAILSAVLASMFLRVYWADHHVKSAQELYRDGLIEETSSHLDKALDLDHERGDARLLRGLIYAMSQRFEDSLGEFRAAERSYDDVTLHYYMGRVYEQMQKSKEALAQYRYALEVFPAGQEITELVRKRIQLLTGQAG